MDLLATVYNQVLLYLFVVFAAGWQHFFTDRLSAAIYGQYWFPAGKAELYIREQQQQSTSESVDTVRDADAEICFATKGGDDRSNGPGVRTIGGLMTKTELDALNNHPWDTLFLFWLLYESGFCATLHFALSCEIDLPGFLLGLPPLFVPYKLYKSYPRATLLMQGVWIVVCIHWGHPWLARYITAAVSWLVGNS